MRTVLDGIVEDWKKMSMPGAPQATRTTVMGAKSGKSGIGSSIASRSSSPTGIYEAPRPVRGPGNRQAMPAPTTPRVAGAPKLPTPFSPPKPPKIKVASVGQAFFTGVRGALAAPWRALPMSTKAALGLTAAGAGTVAAGKGVSRNLAHAAHSRAIHSPQNLRRNQLHQTFWGGRV